MGGDRVQADWHIPRISAWPALDRGHQMDDQRLSGRHPRLDQRQGRAREDALRAILEASRERTVEDGLPQMWELALDPRPDSGRSYSSLGDGARAKES